MQGLVTCYKVCWSPAAASDPIEIPRRLTLKGISCGSTKRTEKPTRRAHSSSVIPPFGSFVTSMRLIF
ncbi:hypothetical protein L1887_35905 [Cichorium endivia]|nr:hypothetical protein L1887_35905 [Cichorium endivia]